MFVHFGELHYGKVDVVPDLCHVATRFFHLNFVPLVPLGSEIVVTGTSEGGGVQRLKTAWSLKSILMAWVRAGLYLALTAGVIGGVIVTAEYFEKRRGSSATMLLLVWGIAAGSMLALWLTYKFSRASYDRAVQLGAELGLDPTLVERYLTVAREDREAAAAADKEPEGWERYS
jgi:hypothetical protein